MENLNAEQIKNDLEHCKFGKDKPICEGCNYKPWIKPRCFGLLCSNALALINSQEQRIKELTDNLHASCTELTRVQEENERLMREKTALECVVSTARNQAKADTVRKMQERINAHFDSDSDYFRSSHGYIRNVVDQIAKEMLKGETP